MNMNVMCVCVCVCVCVCGSTRKLNMIKEILRERLKQKDGFCLQKKKPRYSVIGKFRQYRSRSLQLTSLESDFTLLWLNPLGRKGTVHLVVSCTFFGTVM